SGRRTSAWEGLQRPTTAGSGSAGGAASSFSTPSIYGVRPTVPGWGASRPSATPHPNHVEMRRRWSSGAWRGTAPSLTPLGRPSGASTGTTGRCRRRAGRFSGRHRH
ncbi:unnamed protein product, partial [Ixodes pacificus]